MTATTATAPGEGETLKQYIRDIPDFPQPGVLYRDITPLLNDPTAFCTVINALVERYRGMNLGGIAAVESRGFLFAAPMAYALGVPFIVARKAGKLPHSVHSVTYNLEYGTATLEMHTDAVTPGQRVLVVDDLLATGGTIAATIELVERLGGVVVGAAFVIELTFLGGRDRLPERDVFALISY